MASSEISAFATVTPMVNSFDSGRSSARSVRRLTRFLKLDQSAPANQGRPASTHASNAEVRGCGFSSHPQLLAQLTTRTTRRTVGCVRALGSLLRQRSQLVFAVVSETPRTGASSRANARSPSWEAASMSAHSCGMPKCSCPARVLFTRGNVQWVQIVTYHIRVS